MVAYQVLGDGRPDLVCVPGLVNHMEAAWEEPALARHYRRLSSFSKLVLFDRRGAGLSDRLPTGAALTLEERAEDIAAVQAAVPCRDAFLFATADGASVAIFFAATHPDRVRGLVLWAASARYTLAPDYPIGLPPQRFVDMEAGYEKRWGNEEDPLGVHRMTPSLAGDHRWYRSLARMERMTATPRAAAALWAIHAQTDVRDVLSTVQAPTLVLHTTGDQLFPVSHGQYIADRIPNARFIEFSGTDHLYYSQLGDEVADEIEEFVTGERGHQDIDRVLATVLFTDVVGSTERAARLGDRLWRDLLDTHDETARRHLNRFGGREVKTTGDGVLFVFSAPGRAIGCACAMRDDLRTMGLELRAGIHTGQIERRDADIGGMAVHIAARVQAAANPGEVLVSRTVRDLVAGSIFEWTDRGRHQLRGVPEYWELYGVEVPRGGRAARPSLETST